MSKRFEIGDLVRYDAIIPSYVPGLTAGIGIVVQVGVVDLRVYSMTYKQEVVVLGSSCTILSSAYGRKV